MGWPTGLEPATARTTIWSSTIELWPPFDATPRIAAVLTLPTGFSDSEIRSGTILDPAVSGVDPPSNFQRARHRRLQNVHCARELRLRVPLQPDRENFISNLFSATNQLPGGEFCLIVVTRNPWNQKWQTMIQHRHACPALAHQVIGVRGDAEINTLEKMRHLKIFPAAQMMERKVITPLSGNRPPVGFIRTKRADARDAHAPALPPGKLPQPAKEHVRFPIGMEQAKISQYQPLPAICGSDWYPGLLKLLVKPRATIRCDHRDIAKQPQRLGVHPAPSECTGVKSIVRKNVDRLHPIKHSQNAVTLESSDQPVSEGCRSLTQPDFIHQPNRGVSSQRIGKAGRRRPNDPFRIQAIRNESENDVAGLLSFQVFLERSAAFPPADRLRDMPSGNALAIDIDRVSSRRGNPRVIQAAN